MKATCDRCGIKFGAQEWRYACDKNCTFCERCSTELEGRCPNCNGVLNRLTQ